jgi:hypothetical protein
MQWLRDAMTGAIRSWDERANCTTGLRPGASARPPRRCYGGVDRSDRRRLDDVGAIANRRAFRVGGEPLDLFRRYMAVYAPEQAYCHFNPALSANLERYWGAQNRSG